MSDMISLKISAYTKQREFFLDKDGTEQFDAVVTKRGEFLLINHETKQAWRVRLPEFDYDEAMEELSAIEGLHYA